MAKVRLDKLILERGLVPSREIAQSLILRGDVLVNNVPVTKAGQGIAPDAEIRIRGELPKYVSRGGDKLEGALEDFGFDVSGVVALDVGASTGGFTDCLLQRGAKHVYAVDVGRAQLAEKLRQDPRVTSFEETHARDLSEAMFPEAPNFAVIDVSFIGLRKVLPFVVRVLAAPWQIVALVKPQFELGPESVQQGGVVLLESEQLRAVEEVMQFAREHGWRTHGARPSHLRGAKKGNQEYFIALSGE